MSDNARLDDARLAEIRRYAARERAKSNPTEELDDLLAEVDRLRETVAADTERDWAKARLADMTKERDDWRTDARARSLELAAIRASFTWTVATPDTMPPAGSGPWLVGWPDEVPDSRYVRWSGNFVTGDVPVVRASLAPLDGGIPCWCRADGTFSIRYERSVYAAWPLEPDASTRAEAGATDDAAEAKA